jgi:hypothetical protein
MGLHRRLQGSIYFNLTTISPRPIKATHETVPEYIILYLISEYLLFCSVGITQNVIYVFTDFGCDKNKTLIEFVVVGSNDV